MCPRPSWRLLVVAGQECGDRATGTIFDKPEWFGLIRLEHLQVIETAVGLGHTTQVAKAPNNLVAVRGESGWSRNERLVRRWPEEAIRCRIIEGNFLRLQAKSGRTVGRLWYEVVGMCHDAMGEGIRESTVARLRASR